ncbi:hypothetical protein Pyn_20329 [Prunus yedoensis var. nudiflora]|uniref:Uncharacterized protein n=1 Tax=Prunus yedoensis var. nudiflora TaxID=2094558 RepID=A0A314UUK2_PRUYE|nr:hypothetical protein Pyn_20329 [Prunus yedoensis var. nudiflora]
MQDIFFQQFHWEPRFVGLNSSGFLMFYSLDAKLTRRTELQDISASSNFSSSLSVSQLEAKVMALLTRASRIPLQLSAQRALSLHTTAPSLSSSPSGSTPATYARPPLPRPRCLRLASPRPPSS